MKKSDKTVLVYKAVACLFERYSLENFYGYRGDNWSPASMLTLIPDEIKKQARLSGLSTKDQKTMADEGVKFYRYYFARSMEDLYTLQLTKTKSKKKAKK